jgi:ApaG protein
MRVSSCIEAGEGRGRRVEDSRGADVRAFESRLHGREVIQERRSGGRKGSDAEIVAGTTRESGIIGNDADEPRRSYRGDVSEATTRGIRVQVTSTYLPDRSSPPEQQYFFTYTVRITNVGSERTQLVSRVWIITDLDGHVERVEGPGVVGRQPVLEPGEDFEYASFCPLKTPVGSMEGTYRMVTETGDAFDAVIAPFSLAVPNALH